MSVEELPRQIEALVDNLRANRDSNLSLADVAAVTEVLIATMQTYFRSIDTAIYKECRAMSEYIVNARHEIAALQPKNLESDHIPRAGLELDAIVRQTEEATNTIMESAETIMGADPSDPDAYQAVVNDNIMQIFEACSFQDITGQRISKVVDTLRYIEDRVMELKKLLGITEEDIRKAAENAQAAEEAKDPDSSLLRGPSLDGEGIDQSAVDELLGGEAEPAEASAAGENVSNDDIDALFDSDDAGDTTFSNDDIDALFDGPAETPEEDASTVPVPADEDESVEELAAPKPAAKTEGTSDNADDDGVPGRKTSQADIDALFN